MEEQNFNTLDETNSTLSIKERRGTFLTVISILSWIASGATFITSLFTLIQGKQGVQQQIIDAENQLELIDNELLYEVLENTTQQLYLVLDNFYPIYLTNLVFAALGIYSVYLMFNLKKSGFNFYVAYAIIFPLASYYFVKDMPFAVYGLVFSLMISVVFIAMYYSNLKRMTN